LAFDIHISPEAQADYTELDARWRAEIKAALRTHLLHEPTRISKSRIKRLQGLRRPKYRLRVEDMRIFYDVDAVNQTVEVLRILPKAVAEHYLLTEGIPNDDDPID
jgi:mRNA interferase RelE/StbE